MEDYPYCKDSSCKHVGYQHAHESDIIKWESAINPDYHKKMNMNPPRSLQTKKPMDKIRLFHGSPNKITNGVIEPRFVSWADHGFEDSEGGFHAAFATQDIHDAARYAGAGGHIYEVEEKPHELEGDWDYFNSSSGLKIKQEVGFPGQNLARRAHFATGHNESKK